MVGAHQPRQDRASSRPRWPFPRRARRSASCEEEADGLLERLGLGDVADRLTSGLPYGTLKRIELARALCQRPRLLMLDEPASGLTHGEVEELGELIRALRDELGLAVLLVEHHMGMVMKISDRVVALDFGRKIADGTAGEVQRRPAP